MAAISDAPHVIGVDDVHPAELVARVLGAHNSIVNQFAAEHVLRGPDAGRHELAVVPSAVARWNAPSGARTLSNLTNGAGSIAFSIGFAEAPRLVVGEIPIMRGSGYFLAWKLARPVGLQQVECTVGWSSTGTIEKLPYEADDLGNGAIRLAADLTVNDEPVVPDMLKYMTHITLAIHEMR